MDSFKPKAIPVVQQLIQSTKTHVFLLLAAALFAGQYIIRSEEPQRWVQKITHSQGVSPSKSKYAQSETQNGSARDEQDPKDADSGQQQLSSLRNREITVTAAVEQPIQVGSGTTTPETTADSNSPLFRITYAEVPTETVAKWVNESSGAGLYQNLQEYSAGILNEFRKKMDSNVHVLKVSEKKLQVGQADTNFSGAIADDSGQMIGLATSIEFKSFENATVHGSVMVNRNHRQLRDHFPAEFDLPRHAAFFMLGALRIGSFQNERAQLNMPPFQIFKSPEFMTRKTEFVIIVEPEYK